MNTYAIAINRAFSGKAPYPAPDGFWRNYNGQFRNEQVTAHQFAESVHAGYGYTTWHADYRKAENFVLGQHIALDFDTGDERSTIDTLLSDDFIARFAGFIYTTPSHTPQAPRARVVFFLDRPIRDPHKYTLLARSLLWRYGAADETCKDACRLFYGSTQCDYELTDNVLTLEAAALHLVNPYKAHVAIVEREREETRQRARAQYGDVQADDTMKAAYINRAFDNEYDTVSRALAGDRHKCLLDAALRLGGLLKAAWVPSGVVTEQRITDTLMDAATKNGIVAKYGDADPLRAINNGIGYATPREEPIWKRNEQGDTIAAEPSTILPEIALTPEQAERERQAIARIRQSAWWEGFHTGLSAPAREFWMGLGATERYIESLQLGYDEEGDNLTIPYLSPTGELLNIEYRDSANPAAVHYESAMPSLLHIKSGTAANPILLLSDALEAITAAQYRALHAFDVYALPHLPLDKQSLEPLQGRQAVIMSDTTDERIYAIHKQAKIVHLPLTFPNMVRRGMTNQDIVRYIRQAG